MDDAGIYKLLQATKLVVAPKRILSAYGSTRLNYNLVSPVDDMTDRTRVREGSVLSERPLILTAESLRERFEGFGDDAAGFARWLGEEYRDLLRALEYKFKNQDFRAHVLRDEPRAVSGRIRDDLTTRSVQDTALIECPDAAWSLAVMKLTLDETRRAFPSHVRTYEEHGLFDPGSNAQRRLRREIESLFSAAASDPAARASLGKKLKEYGLFAEYEDRFLALFR
ncbi:MAG: hypothetical protein HY078_06325 [Elusimicrobia bacterium]|nr:hypothetical protein [Elusimicrobiota bacterium]